MRTLLLLAGLGLAGCAGQDRLPGPSASLGARPASVTLYRDTVTVGMSDGALCTGVRNARSGPWRTTLQGCAHPWDVSVLRTTARPRLPLVPAAAEPWVVLTPPGAASLSFAPAIRPAV